MKLLSETLNVIRVAKETSSQVSVSAHGSETLANRPELNTFHVVME